MVVGFVGLLNLVILLVLGRRLAFVNERLAKVLGGPGAGAMRPVGLPVGEFTTSTVDGEPVDRDALRGWTLVAALSPDCVPCHERLPEFLTACHEMPGGRGQVLAIIATDPTDPDGGLRSAGPLVEQLRPVARVVVESGDGPVGQAFAVIGYPSFALVDPEGVIAFGGHHIDMSLLPAAADA
jgi:hypothetical protein